MLALLKLLLFVISTFGTFELIRKISGDEVNIYFLPSLTAAIQVCVLFLAGLLNLLPEAVYALYLVGFAGFIYSVCKNKGLSSLKAYLNPGYILTFALLLIFAVYLRGKVFTHYDNYSHWGLVVKRMLETNRYPNFKDTLIQFQEYPLGSSSYIYFFVKLTKTSESFQMLAQTYVMLAAMLSLYSFAKQNHLAVSVVMVSFVNYVFWYNDEITDLLVDTLLPLVGICGLLFAYRHCKEGRKCMLCFAACYMVQVMQIKNSGIYFVILTAIFILSSTNSHHIYIYRGLCAAAPFLSFLLWHKHCDYVFESADTSRHAMTIESFKAVFGEKTREDIITICTKLLRFAVSYKEVWITVGICALIGVLILLTRKELGKVFFKVALLSIAVYVTYQLGNLGMYLFSMPGSEATELASFDRYTKTILIAILFLNMVPAVMLLSELSGEKVKTAAAAACIFMSFFAGMYVSTGSITTALQDEKTDWEEDFARKRKFIENGKRRYGIPMHDSYFVLIPHEDDGYAIRLGKFIFLTDNVGEALIRSEDELNDISQKYIFVYDRENEIIQNWIQKVYPEQVGNDVIIRPETNNQ